MAGNMPIRWDNINGGGLSEAARPLESSANLFANAFSSLQGALKERESIDQANWQNTKANNTTDFLNNLYGKYTDADSLNAAIKNGDIANQLKGYGYQIDANAVRGAADARMQALMQQATQKIAYDHAMTDEKVAPIVDQAHAAALRGDTTEFNRLAAQYTALNGRDLAGVLAYKDTRDRQIVERQHADRTSDDTHNKTLQDILASKADVTYKQGMLGVAQANSRTEAARVGIEQQRVNMEHVDRLQSRLSDAIKNGTVDPKATIGSPAGAAALAEATKGFKGDAEDVARRYVAQLLDKNPSITVAAALNGLASVREQRWYETRNGVASDAVDRAVASAGTPAALEYQKRAEAQYSLQQANVDSLRNALGRARTIEEANLPTALGGTGGAAKTSGKDTTVPAPVAAAPSTPSWDGKSINNGADGKVYGADEKGHYGPNGWEPGPEKPVDPVAQAKAVLESTKGVGYNEMTPEQRKARSEARATIKAASEPDPAAALRAAAQAQANQQAEVTRQGQAGNLKRQIDALELAKKLNMPADNGDAMIAQLKQELAKLSKK